MRNGRHHKAGDKGLFTVGPVVVGAPRGGSPLVLAACLGLALLGGCSGAKTANFTSPPGGHENHWREAIELIADADGQDPGLLALRGHWSQAVRSALEAADADEDGKLAELLAASRCTAMAAAKLEHGLPDCGGGSCLIRGKSVPIGVSKIESEPQPQRWKGPAPPNLGPARLEDGTVVLATEAGAIALSEGRLGRLE